jgi:outer membrane lipoprotein-sorting protein
MRKCIALFLMLLFLFTESKGQEKNAVAILEGVKKKFSLIEDYKATATIKVDVDFIKIPVKNSTIWFVKPDQIKVKTDGFSLLPKRGLNFSPNKLFQGNYATLYSREEKEGNDVLQVLKVIPQDENDDIILSTLWIDENRNVIKKLETTTKNEGTFVMRFIYGNNPGKYDLPQQIIFNFDLRKNELPLGLTGDFENSRPKEKGNSNSRGTVTITYLGYAVNEGKGMEGFKKSKSK